MSVFILGPSTTHLEPMPSVAPGPTPGRRGITLHATTPTQPGGKMNVVLNAAAAGDKEPINIYAFFVQPVESVPAGAALTTDFFFKSGAPSGSSHVSTADPAGNIQIVASGVKPSLSPHFAQSILEYDS